MHQNMHPSISHQIIEYAIHHHPTFRCHPSQPFFLHVSHMFPRSHVSFYGLQATAPLRVSVAFGQFVFIHSLPLQGREEAIPNARATTSCTTSALKAIGLGIPHRTQGRDHRLFIEESGAATPCIQHIDHVLMKQFIGAFCCDIQFSTSHLWNSSEKLQPPLYSKA